MYTVSRLSKLMRVSYGLRCVYDEICVGISKVSENCGSMKIMNCYNVLQHKDSTEHGRAIESVVTSPICGVGQSRKPAPKIKHRRVRIGLWNFQGLCSDKKALEISEVLSKNRIDIIGCQESWELEAPKFLGLVINGLVSLGKELKVRGDRVE